MSNRQKNPEVSVIIPVYNVEKYLRKCIQSLLDQTFRDFEIIAVNDGSPDNCLSILREYEAQYDCITVLSQENRGMSMARNNGLSVARGKYVCFVDSDDYVAPTYLECLHTACVENNAQISNCYYYYHYVESDLFLKYPFRCKGVFGREEALNKLLHDMEIQSLVWNKMYERRLFTDYGISYPAMCFEDMAIAARLFERIERLAVVNEPLYFYNQRSGSTLATMNAAKINDFARAMGMVRIALERSGSFQTYRKSYGALLRKTGTYCTLQIAKLHMRKRSLRGCLSNIKRLLRAFRHFATEDFSPLYTHFPDVVCEPEDKKKLEKDYLAR